MLPDVYKIAAMSVLILCGAASVDDGLLSVVQVVNAYLECVLGSSLALTSMMVDKSWQLSMASFKRWWRSLEVMSTRAPESFRMCCTC